MNSPEIQGRVIAHHRAHRLVKTVSGDLKSAKARSKAQNAIVGDWVRCSEVDQDTLCIEAVDARNSVLERLDRRGRNRTLASNFERIIVVSAPAPGIDRLMIDQYLVAAESTGVQPIVLINKIDLLSEAEQTATRSELDCYAQCGYDIIMCSARHADSLAALDAALQGQSCVFVGQSGVGKSSLIQHFVPNQDIAVGALSKAGLGSHTTIAAYWYETVNGGAVIDSPGVREFRVDHFPPEAIVSGFTEIVDAAADCRFSNCSHRHEPDCAVKAGVEAHTIDRVRHQNFVSLLTESEATAPRR